MHGSKTDARLQKATRGVAEAIPGAAHRVLTGQTHNVKPGRYIDVVDADEVDVRELENRATAG